MNDAVRRLVLKNRRLGHKLNATNWSSKKTISEYKIASKNCKDAILSRVREYETEISSDKRNPKRLFSYASFQKRVKVGVSALTNAKGQTVTEGKAMAEALNEQFKSAFTEEDDADPPDFPRRTETKMLDRDFGEAEILELLNKLDAWKSPGDDGVHPYVLKNFLTLFLSLFCFYLGDR